MILFILLFYLGLPHAHILIILEDVDKPRSIEDINRIVSAELPDPETHPQAFETVSKMMIHGPCGIHNSKSPCMVDGKCTKQYPRALQPQTTRNNDGYPIYRRRVQNISFTNHAGVNIDNTWVVPHNVALATLFDCYINVEICSTIRAVQYIYKYIFKG